MLFDMTNPARRTALVNATLRSLAIGYPVAVLIFMLSLRLVGERWWGTTLALYLPRLPFALPLVPLTVAIVWIGPRRLLWTQFAAIILLLKLMGFELALPTSPTPGALQLRLASCNTDGGALGWARILRPLLATNPDIIILQEAEADPLGYARLKSLVPGYYVSAAGQFWLASRFPVDPDVVRSPRFARYRIVTPAGPLILYNVHPISPRDGLEEVRGDGIRHQILRGDLFNTRARTTVRQNTQLRISQLQDVVANARGSLEPVLIAGDTNLPGLSWTLAHQFGSYRDGFSETGNGFGYSYPSPRHPWMRIDRVMADQHFRFLDFKVIDSYISDHFAVVTDIEFPAASSAAH
jgi:endonuclease/exonuclease/phosphatase family metal-dependent hydrolase